MQNDSVHVAVNLAEPESRLVPVEPTSAMLNAYNAAEHDGLLGGWTKGDIQKRAYRAMIAAAPTSAQQGEV